MFREKGLVQSSPGITLKKVYIKEKKSQSIKAQLEHSECFGAQNDLDLARRFDKVPAEDSGEKKLVLPSVGQNKIPDEH